VGVAANTLELKELTWTPETDAAAGKTIHVYSGTFLRNEKDPTLIKRRSYQLERTLGVDANGTQSEVLVGAVANEFSMSLDSADKITCDLSFVAMDTHVRDGNAGLKPGNRTAKISEEEAFNTSKDVYQQRLFVHSDVPTPSSVFAYVSEASLNISNGASGLKAIGNFGSFEINLGDFEVGGELEVYFSTVEAIEAVKNNADVGYNAIIAADNAGIVYDIPLLSLGGGRVSVEKDEPIMLPLSNTAAENEYGYTMSATYFSYLPEIAMA